MLPSMLFDVPSRAIWPSPASSPTSVWHGRSVFHILIGDDTVTNVTLRQLTVPDAILSLHGRFEILSLSGSILPPHRCPPVASCMTIYISGAQGQVVGGAVVGQLLASGPVVIMAASFSNLAYECLPLEDEEALAAPPGLGRQAANSGENTNLYQGMAQNMVNLCQLPDEGYNWLPGTGILFSVRITGVLTDSIKDAVGRSHPDFFWRRFPNGKDLCRFTTEWGGVVCYGDKAVIKEEHKSFPSRHTSCLLVSTFCYLQFLAPPYHVDGCRTHAYLHILEDLCANASNPGTSHVDI